MTTKQAQTKATGGQALASVKYQAMAPMGSKRTLQGLLESQMHTLQAVLPKHVTPDRLIKTLMLAVNRQPDLLKCTQESVLESVIRAAELGLDLSGTLGEAYLVPFNNKIKVDGKDTYVLQATFIPGYRGLAKLARQSGEVKRIEAEVVYENDHFIYRKGVKLELEFQPSFGDDRGKVLGVYALVEFKDGGIQSDFMTYAEVEKVRQGAKSKNSPAWLTRWNEMGKKSVFRRLSKWLPLSGEKWTAALEADNADFDLGNPMPVIEVDLSGSKAESLVDRLSGGTVDEAIPGEVIDASWSDDQRDSVQPDPPQTKPKKKPKKLSIATMIEIEKRIKANKAMPPSDVRIEIEENFGEPLENLTEDREDELLELFETLGV